MKLFAANGTTIPTFGQRLLKLELQLRREFSWPFIIAVVPHPIIGADFLRSFGLLVDVKNAAVIDPLSKLQTRGTRYAGIASTVKVILENYKFHNLLSEFSALIRSAVTPRKVKHGVEHWIQTKGPPIFSKPRRLSPDKLKDAKQEFESRSIRGLPAFQKLLGKSVTHGSKKEWRLATVW
ncbi:uncharacterized protein [Parasteatoda tepidariorum]|uniref:uncharacterized protein n=1 Tax=Parasteatoda tepidariorum TaxID=114398 RepID=UPI00077F8592|nr:uncharacterized protein LOC107441234 [Parasteatoda tepidariorum]